MVCSVTDEALIWWIMMCWVPDWEKEMMEDMGSESENSNPQTKNKEPPRKKQRKKPGKHYSATKLGEFCEFETHIKSARTDPKEGQGWDDALMKEALLKGKSKVASQFTDASQAGVDVVKPVAKKYVMTYYGRGDDTVLTNSAQV